MSGGRYFASLPAGKRRFALDIRRPGDGSAVLDMTSWIVRPAEPLGPSRLYPQQIVLDKDGTLSEVLSNGVKRVIPLNRPLPKLLQEGPDGIGDPKGTRALAEGLLRKASQDVPRSRTPLQTIVISAAEGERRLHGLRQQFGDGIRTAPSQLTFEGRRGSQTARVVFDEYIGGITVLEVGTEAGVRITKRMSYEKVDSVHVMTGSETVVSGPQGEQRFVEHHGRQVRQGAVK